jgi:hypothetical protein
MLDGYLAGSRYGMNQSKASPRIEYTQVETNVPKSDCLFVVTLISLGIIPHDAYLPFTFDALSILQRHFVLKRRRTSAV